MIDKKLWSEAKDIAKDQMRHGKIHYSDFEKVTKVIYDDLLRMENGPVIDVMAMEEQVKPALPAASVSKFKHEIVDGEVRCAECGNLFKTLAVHIKQKHGMDSIAYMAKHGVSRKDMQGTIERNARTGGDNPLTILSNIMKAYDIKRNEVKPFVAKNGFKDLKDLMAQAKDKGMSTLDLLKEKAPTPAKKAE
ncbi:MAG: MucR family transcriptional regulator [Solidesulfovibrio sp.]|uniref:MucR family transcriptional regulator n=1 Tax=Solidesulfovibrio sp. TaxID=2910990 RepID=UPI00315888F6